MVEAEGHKHLRICMGRAKRGGAAQCMVKRYIKCSVAAQLNQGTQGQKRTEERIYLIRHVKKIRQRRHKKRNSLSLFHRIQ